ncbi:hypothetical protein [Sphingomonas rubra]|uniref:Uncharacterized protein n=1 Tax=Sphingomonas rubra TaxID=634430 RepID=A0A1I5TJW1_9SPHN|nr:hypothetical protein [Sphingomonas rubra]SFP82937.1 hypothetical protein SAMN04488241_10869 [Sphingomonas rubra]
MASDRIVAVGLLTAADVALLGQGFRRLYPVPRGGDFGGLLDALDRVTFEEERAMSMPRPEEAPSEVSAVDGRVLVDGPGGVAITFTADAARETGLRLQRAGEEAAGQTVRDDDGE